MSGRVAVIAGATRGIGLAVVENLARAWDRKDFVYLTARNPADGERIVAASETSGATIAWLPYDMAASGDGQHLADMLVERHGGVDIALLNGGFAPAHDAPPERDARAMIEANNHGALRFLRAMTPILRENARLAVTASGMGLLKNLPDGLKPLFDTRTRTVDEIDRAMDRYVAAAETGRLQDEGWPAWVNVPSKVGQVAVTRAFAKAYSTDAARKEGVLINALCPGLTLTDATAGLMDNVFKGRPAQTPEEAAVDVVWLMTLPPGTKAPYGELVQKRIVLPFGD